MTKALNHTQSTNNTATVDGETISGDSFSIVSLVEEDGELKILRWKNFTDEQYSTYKDIKARGICFVDHKVYVKLVARIIFCNPSRCMGM